MHVRPDQRIPAPRNPGIMSIRISFHHSGGAAAEDGWTEGRKNPNISALPERFFTCITPDEGLTSPSPPPASLPPQRQGEGGRAYPGSLSSVRGARTRIIIILRDASRLEVSIVCPACGSDVAGELLQACLRGRFVEVEIHSFPECSEG